jgi:GST-like protein
MIELYTAATPNGKKISIALEELALPYRVHKIDISKGDQHSAEFTRLNPNQKIPVIVDTDTGMTLAESGAILLYLANKTGQLIPVEKEGYWAVVQWLMWQKAGFGPMLGQAHHFIKFNPGKSEYAERRYGKETERLYGVLDRQLSKGGYVVDGEYSIADIAAWPWAARHSFQGIDLNDFPNVLAWYLEIAARPAVRAGWAVPIPEEVPMPRGFDDD